MVPRDTPSVSLASSIGTLPPLAPRAPRSIDLLEEVWALVLSIITCLLKSSSRTPQIVIPDAQVESPQLETASVHTGMAASDPTTSPPPKDPPAEMDSEFLDKAIAEMCHQPEAFLDLAMPFFLQSSV